MELKHTNPNGESILATTLNLMELFTLKNYEDWLKKKFYTYMLFSQEDAIYKCLENKMLHNFHITNPKTNPNGMNKRIKSFPYRQKCDQ